MLSEFPDLTRWEENVRALGHGTSHAMRAEDAIDQAKNTEPVSETGATPHYPQDLRVGTLVAVSPDVEGGEQPVEGKVRYADAETIAILRTSDEVGTVCVHFPRSGYRVSVT